jgi:hypothetical protein
VLPAEDAMPAPGFLQIKFFSGNLDQHGLGFAVIGDDHFLAFFDFL